MSAIAEAIPPPSARWDLSALFAAPTDPKIDALWQSLKKRASAFEKAYRGKIDSPDLTAELLLGAIRESEVISTEAAKPIGFAHLLFAADTSDPALGAFMAKQMEKASELSVKLMFFELELQAAPQSVIAPLMADDRLAAYRHYVAVARSLSPYRLNEDEEVILEETANTGCRAWVRLFEEVVSNHGFRFTRPGGEPETLSQQEILALLRESDREVRQAAADAFSEGLKAMERVLVFTYNNLLQDKAVDDRLRTFEYPEQSRHLANELEKASVDLVVRLCREHYGLVERFYTVKRSLLGLDKLTHVDRYAPLFEAQRKVSYDEGKRMVLAAFGGFSPELEARAREFFDRDWIDAEPRAGKRGGAFCSYNTPDTHPVVLLSYLNKTDDVMTLAHELGHGVHASLSRTQSYFNFHGTLPLAELASTFGEMLVFESLVAEASPREQLALYAEKIEGIFATVFRQAAMFRFEQRCHVMRREQGELTAAQFGEIWHEELQAMFGDSVELGEQHRAWWSYVSHFVAVPFYVYAYSFGELLVLSLYQLAKAEGAPFAKKYVDLLKLGGSRSPQELMATVGVDLNSEAFWRGGFAAMEKLVEEFEALVHSGAAG
ncbi:MAG: M3 family oligoendopeptidase [Fimbriimonadaceae bacterium]